MRSAGSWVLAILSAAALTAAIFAAYADRTVFRADGFAARADASLQSEAVRAALARRLADAAIRSRPDLVAVRPLVESAAGGIVRTEAFRSIVRGAARDVHRSVFDREAGTVTLAVGDAGVLLAEALRHIRPELAERIPDDLQVRAATVGGGAETTVLRAVELSERIRAGALLALVAAVLLGLGAVLVSPSRRAAALRLGLAVAACSGIALAVVALVPHVVTSGAGARAALAAWLDPLVAWCAATCAAGAVVALAAASVVRPVALAPLLRRVRAAIVRVPVSPRLRAARAVVAIGVGAALVLEPRFVLELAVVVAGLLIALAGIGELLRLVADPAAQPVRRPRAPRGARIAAVAVGLIAGIAAVATFAAGDHPGAPRVGRCNGHAALCDRPLDRVAFAGTHNSMAADGEPGWLFVAHDAGIDAQLREGIHALLIDTHYGFATPRGVATDIARASKSREKLVGEVGERFVDTAERLRTRIGYTGGGTPEIFLCHAFCEVGATPAKAALAGVHRFLVTHPEEVLILSIEDDTTAADTAALIRESGLIREVYRGPARPPWPTLRELIDRDERVLVLVENDVGDEPWMHRQAAVAQETPYNFRTAEALAAPASCAPNRGGTAGSLLLFNHWVDTSPAPRKSIARQVNAPAFLDARLARCRAERRLLPHIVAVDFYRQGDLFGAVARINALR